MLKQGRQGLPLRGETGKGKERGFWDADHVLYLDLIACDKLQFI